MAMKVNIIPSASYGLSPALKALADLTPVDILEGKSPEEVNKLRLLVRSAINQSQSKYKPRVDRVRQRSTNHQRPVKKPEKPVLVSSSPEPVTYADESAQLAAWLEFYNPPRNKKGEPLMVAYPVDPLEKAKHKRKSRDSQSCRSHMKTLRAVGITPRAHISKPQPITSTVEPDWSYFKEVVLKRHLERESMEAELANRMATVSCDKMVEDEIAYYSLRYGDVYVNESKAPVEEFVGPPMPVAISTDDQRCLPSELLDSDDSEAVRYAHALRFYDNEPNWHLPFIDIYTMDNYDESEGIAYVEWLRKHDSTPERMYREFCNVRCNPAHAVNLGEDIPPQFTMYHNNPAAYNLALNHFNSKRLANIHYDEVGCMGMRNWMHQYWPNKTQANASGVDLNWMGIDKVLEQKHKEKFAERIIDHALRKKSGFAQWSQNINLGKIRMDFLKRKLEKWKHDSYMKDTYYFFWSWSQEVAKPIEDRASVPWDTEVSIDTTAANDAIIRDDGPTVSNANTTAEVVDLAARRNKHNDEVDALTSKLRAGLQAKISSLSDDELKVVHKLFEDIG